MKKLLITAVMLLAAGTLVSAGGWEQALSSGAVQFGGESSVVWYNYGGSPSSFLLDYFRLDASAELRDDVLVRAELEWAGQEGAIGGDASRWLPFRPGGDASRWIPIRPGADESRWTSCGACWLRGEDEGVNLRYAYIDYALLDSMTLRAGKFLVPFNVYNERIDGVDAKLAVPPMSAMWGMADTGLQIRGFVDTGADVGLDYAVYYVNGLTRDLADESDKGLGGRLGIVTPAGFELGLSGYQAEAFPGEEIVLRGADMCYKYETMEFRGEFVRAKEADEAISGFYLQAAYGFLDRYEIVVRFDELDDLQSTILGGNYELTEDLTLRVAYEWSDLENGLSTQLAVRF